MEFKKKTIIWEDNNEPPKDYIWAKKDGKFYEYNYATRSWIESKLIKAEKSGGNGDGGTEENDRVSLIDVLKETVKFRIEEGIDSPEASDEIVYPDTFIVDTGEEEYEEISHSATSLFLFNPQSYIPAYNNPPTFSTNKLYALQFNGSPTRLSDDASVVKITTMDNTEYGGYPSKELYIFSDGGEK